MQPWSSLHMEHGMISLVILELGSLWSGLVLVLGCPESFPNLSDLQKRKLKQLTAVTTVQGQKVSSISNQN